MEEVSVSVVMPAYNAAQYIENTISSLQHQTYNNWELIVVDDCSTDSTCDLVTRIAEDDHRIRLIRLEKNFGGPAGPRNVGVSEARYDLVAFLDSDDIWHPQKLEKQVDLVESPDEFFACSSMIDFEDDSTIEFPEIGQVSVDHIGFMAQSFRAKIPTSSVVVSKSLVSKFPFEESPNYKAVEDFHCWLRILNAGVKCRKVREPLLYYRKSEGQISGSKLKMMKKVFMVHMNYPGRGLLTSILFTASHILGGLYFRYLRKGM
ncbi:glycosyltransferase family 2 protein [Marinobacter sp. R17]|uniref:glycosyltransferase family 2 protein n=1 Tax=Marinobacter sp. R17 TaxID=2484250 RepID=UPI001680D0BD|nr:glycosyltransferase family 2 protein [Marinobacter sp. R17]